MTKQELQAVIGGNLRKFRTGQNLTIEQLAERAGISTTFYSNLECGNKMMSVATLVKLAGALHVSPDSLLYEREPPDCLESVALLLQDLPREEIAFIGEMIRFYLANRPPQKSTQEGVLSPHDRPAE